MAIRPLRLPTMALHGLHCLHGFHPQLIHPQPRPVLVNHHPAQVLTQAYEKTCWSHDRHSLDDVLNMGSANTLLALVLFWWNKEAARGGRCL